MKYLNNFLIWCKDKWRGVPLGGIARSPKFSILSKETIKEHPFCSACGAKDKLLNRLNSHHVRPFHLFPEDELKKENLIVLCRICHFLLAHLKNWSSYNLEIREMASTLLEKIKGRP